ncbi:hypothetical protein H0H92_004409 [Tricholoma furcatifolium]|nr:hypothetical protein H0H92_004409 [Tricholoma furcatifolium]
MRHMIPMFSDVARKVQEAIKLQLVNGRQEIDILQWMSRAALEMIGQSGLGYSFDPLVQNAKPHPFAEAAKAFGLVSTITTSHSVTNARHFDNHSPATTKMFFASEYILPTLVKLGSPRFRRRVLDLLPFKALHKIRDIVDIMDRTTVGIFEEKKKAFREGEATLAKQIGQAKDLISILMKANMEASEEDRLPDKEVLAQASFVNDPLHAFADHPLYYRCHTTSNALSRILHLLALHPEAQERLRAEVTAALKTHNGDVPYDELVALPFMDAVCRETLRLARQDIVLPLSSPIKGIDGRELDSILVPQNTKVLVGILNANRDPMLWGPDSLDWKPERWLAPLPQALLDAQVMLSTLVSHFRFYPPEKEIVWQISSVTYPALKDSPEQPQLPLKMEITLRNITNVDIPDAVATSFNVRNTTRCG